MRKLVDDGPLAPAQLADDLVLARSTISNVLKGLEADGLVHRDRSPHDGRSIVVTPTRYGRDVLQEFRLSRLEVLTKALEAMETPDRDQLEKALPLFERLLIQLEIIANDDALVDRKPA